MLKTALAAIVLLSTMAGCDNLWSRYWTTKPDSLLPGGRACAGQNPYWVAIGDVTKDGIADLVVTNRGSKDVLVLAGDGQGQYVNQAHYRLAFMDTPVAGEAGFG